MQTCAQASSEELRLSAVRAIVALVKGSCIAELHAEGNAPLLGHALSLLLQVADNEASAGDRGSRTLRAEAFCALELMQRQVRTIIVRDDPAGRIARLLMAGCMACLIGWRARCACFFLAWHLQRPVHCDTQKHNRCSRGANDTAPLHFVGSSRTSPLLPPGHRADKVSLNPSHVSHSQSG